MFVWFNDKNKIAIQLSLNTYYLKNKLLLLR